MKIPLLPRPFRLPALLLLGSALALLPGRNIAAETGATAPSKELSMREELTTLAARLEKDPALKQRIAPILAEAQQVRDLPVVTRATSLAELEHPDGRRFGSIDARTYLVQKTAPAKAELFSLASADLETTQIVGREMPLLASAYLLTHDPSYAARVVAQLREVTTWVPLQRPGWTLYTAANSLPADGNDGAWLSTGAGLIALCQTLELMPEKSIPDDVRAAVRKQLADECRRTLDDWQHKRQWFVKSHVPNTNQWVVPSAGLVAAAATLGRDANPEAYDLGVANLRETMAGVGDDGSIPEGMGYGGHFTGPFLYLANHFLRMAGDNQLADAPFLRNFPTWIAANYQPGLSVVNTCDAYGSNRNMYPSYAPDLARQIALTRSSLLGWIQRHVVKTASLDFYGLLAAGMPDDALKEPPLWGDFKLARNVMWRDSWADDASGVWVRGGNASNFTGHEHNDRGHVNFISHGRLVLIGAGTTGYDSPLKSDKYDSVIGANVLQVGDDIHPKKAGAALTVNAIDARGGDVTVDAGDGYPQVARWQRHVVWDANHVEVTDHVELKAPERLLFRWHFGSEQDLAITPSGPNGASATLPAGRLTFAGWSGKLPTGIDWTPPAQDIVETPAATATVQADQPVTCTEEKDLDHTIKFRVQKHLHSTLVVSSAGPVSAITIKTVVASP